MDEGGFQVEKGDSAVGCALGPRRGHARPPAQHDHRNPRPGRRRRPRLGRFRLQPGVAGSVRRPAAAAAASARPERFDLGAAGGTAAICAGRSPSPGTRLCSRLSRFRPGRVGRAGRRGRLSGWPGRSETARGAGERQRASPSARDERPAHGRRRSASIPGASGQSSLQSRAVHADDLVPRPFRQGPGTLGRFAGPFQRSPGPPS